jgi:pimeloyl-ACP methyl ester carboxylesterase
VVRFLTLAAALVASGAIYQRVGARRQKQRFAPPGVLIDVGGHRLHARCLGEGRPVVLLEAGIAASSVSWAAVQPQIAAFTRVCAYDRAGLAWSEAPSRPLTFARIVDDLAAVLERAAPGERYVLVGHSFGSFVVRAYASRHPERVAGIVLVDPALEWLTVSAERARMLWGGRHLSRIGAVLAHLGVVRACLALLAGGTPAAPRRFVKIFGPTAAATLERLVLEVRKLPAEVHPVVQALWCQPKCFHAMADHLQALERDTASIAAVCTPRSIPLVVISGGDQPAEQIAAHERLAAASAEGRHVVATRSAHWIQFDEPGLIVDAVRQLVGSQRAREGAATAIR